LHRHAHRRARGRLRERRRPPPQRLASFSRRARGHVIRRRPSVRAPITTPTSPPRDGAPFLVRPPTEVRSTHRPHPWTELGWPFCINGGTSLAASSAISPSSSFC